MAEIFDDALGRPRVHLEQVLADAAEGRNTALFWRLLSAFQWLEVVVRAPRPVG